MSIKKLPEIQARQSKNISFDPRDDALAHWQPEKIAAQAKGDVLNLYGIVGDDWSDTPTPITAAAVSEFLKGKGDIIVSINSAGGDYFEGIAIYNLLRNHAHKITVQVIGDASSAASVIAMAGDEILMGEGAFMMIHNCWGYAVGNRADLAQSIEIMAKIDDAMADLYVAQTGKNKAEIVAMLDAETWLNAETAVNEGFATGLLQQSSQSQANANTQRKAKAQIESALRAQGLSRSQSRQVLQNYKADPMPRAAVSSVAVKPRADLSLILEQLNSLE